ncbi:MAG: putative sugar nucleotidyl transferase [Candidatus Kapaibacterium sp.]
MICLFEDHLTGNFYPVSLTHHLSDLLVGARTLRARAMRATGSQDVTIHGRKYIREYYAAARERVEPPIVPTTFLNARVAFNSSLTDHFPDGPEWIARRDEITIAARLLPETIAMLDWDADALDFSSLDGVPVVELAMATPYEYLWDLIYDNGARIAEDFQAGVSSGGTIMQGAHSIAEERIAIGEGSVVKPGCVIDASHGPVIIGRDVEMMPNAVIEGPCSIGDGSRIKIGAKIYEGTSIGPYCKVGGEVENSIILGYSNKQHDGFLGHSYLGCWVNLGADTNTSDLKNNYGTIRVVLDGRQIDTGRMFLGSLIGDQSKTGINTMLNTGTVIGVAANIFGGGFAEKSIPSFAWGGFGEAERFRLDDAIELSRRVAARRGIMFGPANETLLRYLYERSR